MIIIVPTQPSPRPLSNHILHTPSLFPLPSMSPTTLHTTMIHYHHHKMLGTWRDADPVEVKAKIDAGDEYTVRFKVPSGKVVSIDDAVRGTVTWNAEECLGDFIILRSSGMPVYNFCVAVDDANMQITHVVRAEEHLSNTLRQMLILEALEFTPPK